MVDRSRPIPHAGVEVQLYGRGVCDCDEQPEPVGLSVLAGRGFEIRNDKVLDLVIDFGRWLVDSSRELRGNVTVCYEQEPIPSLKLRLLCLRHRSTRVDS